ncbi:protein kinase domain-containing protein [Streptomyces sp. NPDC054841]
MTGANEAAGRVITGRYRLLRRLGTGGMGRVWLAYDQELACEVALKEIILPPDIPEPEVGTRIARARCEARHAARLRNHPDVVTVHDIVEDGGLPWIVMDFVPGAMDLEAVVHKWGPLRPADVARIGLVVLDALREGHRLGILHRDVKPANILLTHPDPQHNYPTERGQVLLTDYGIALEPDSGEARLTATLEIIGTPRFMAPERARSEAPTPAADLFSLGATLYFAVEGSGPFDRDSFLSTLGALMFEPPTPPRRAAELTPVLLELLTKDAADRMDGDEAAQRLTSIAAQPQPTPSQQTTLPPVMPPPERPPTSKPPRPQESAPPAEHVPPTEPEEPTGPAPGPRPRKGDEARLRPRPLWAGHRRAGLIAGVVAVALAAVGGGIYLTQSPSPGPERSSIRVGKSPAGVAVSPDGRRVYVTNFGSDSVSVIETATNRTVDDPIPVGNSPKGVAVSKDGRRVYVTNNDSASVSVIDATKNRTMGNPIAVGDTPEGVAVSQDGRVYVANGQSSSVSVIDPATNRTMGNPIPVGHFPKGVAVSPDGRRVYVTNYGSDSVSVIETATNRAADSIPVGNSPTGVAVSKDGRRVYVTNNDSASVSVIDATKNRTMGNPIAVGDTPEGVAVSQDGRVYVANRGSDSVSVIDPATNRTADSIPVGRFPTGVDVTPAARRVYVANGGSDLVSVITF